MNHKHRLRCFTQMVDEKQGTGCIFSKVVRIRCYKHSKRCLNMRKLWRRLDYSKMIEVRKTT